MTFRASIPSLVIESVLSKFPADRTFTFSKRRIFFSEAQLDTYKFGLGNCRLLHQTEYTLQVIYDKTDKRQYQITYNQNCTATLKLDRINLFRLKIIHGLIKIPKWLKWTIEKIFDSIIKVLIPLITGYIGFLLGKCNETTNTTSQLPKSNKEVVVQVQPKKGVHSDTDNSYNNIDTSHSVPFQNDSSKQNDTTHKH